MNVYDLVEEFHLIAIIRGIEVKDLVPLAKALYDGGVRLVEITMNTHDATEMIALLNDQFGEKLYVGAGTVVDLESAEKAFNAGANYFITPNLDEEVIEYAIQNKIGIIPGVMTSSEIVKAYKTGARMVKVFPTSSLGSNYIKELQGPLSHIPMIAVGGVTPVNVAEFIEAGAVGVGVGGSLIDKKSINEGDFESISRNAALFLQNIKGVEK